MFYFDILINCFEFDIFPNEFELLKLMSFA